MLGLFFFPYLVSIAAAAAAVVVAAFIAHARFGFHCGCCFCYTRRRDTVCRFFAGAAAAAKTWSFTTGLRDVFVIGSNSSCTGRSHAVSGGNNADSSLRSKNRSIQKRRAGQRESKKNPDAAAAATYGSRCSVPCSAHSIALDLGRS